MPEPLTLTRSRPSGRLPLAQHGEHLGGERLVELDQVDVAERQAGALQRLARWRAPARCPSSRAATPATAQETSRAKRPQAELGGLLGVGDDADGRAVVLAAGVARRDGRLGVAAAP